MTKVFTFRFGPFSDVDRLSVRDVESGCMKDVETRCKKHVETSCMQEVETYRMRLRPIIIDLRHQIGISCSNVWLGRWRRLAGPFGSRPVHF